MTKINWKLRLKNKATLAALIAAAVAFIYQILGIVGVVPAIAQNDVIQGVGIALNLLAALGVVVDPTTEGAGDSTQALGYDAPASDVSKGNTEAELVTAMPSETVPKEGDK